MLLAVSLLALVSGILFAGESQVYTVGLIGKHRVVSTKLSRIGRAKFDQTAAGNNVTRLLGRILNFLTHPAQQVCQS